uniref:DUF4147 domain-containing protein n=1 Tax=Panagrellus redivivus TaxID=6233 RepID=A0A7E4VAG3_PANRE
MRIVFTFIHKKTTFDVPRSMLTDTQFKRASGKSMGMNSLAVVVVGGVCSLNQCAMDELDSLAKPHTSRVQTNCYLRGFVKW